MTNKLKLSVSLIALVVAGPAVAQTTSTTPSGSSSSTTATLPLTTSASTSACTTSSGGTRTPFDQPYANTSPWNIGIGSGAQWDTTSAAAQHLHTLGGMINTTDWGYPTFDGKASDPLVSLHVSDGEIPDQQIHIPASAHPAGGTDHNMSFFDDTQPGKVWTLWGVQFNNGKNVTGGITAGIGDMFDSTGDGHTIPSYAPNENGGQYSAGVITPYDLQQGAIQHALRVALSNDAESMPAGGKPQFPVNVVDYDGPTAYKGNIPASSTFGIPSMVNLSSLGLSQGGMMLALALQRYGAIWQDTAGSNAFTIDSEPSTASNPLMGQMQSDVQKLIPYLAIMTNQGADTINGGGSYPYEITTQIAASGLTTAQLNAANACAPTDSAAQQQVAEQAMTSTGSASSAVVAQQNQVSEVMAANNTGQTVTATPSTNASTPSSFNAPVSETLDSSKADGGYQPAVAVAANAGNTTPGPTGTSAPTAATATGGSYSLASDNATQTDASGSNSYAVTGSGNALFATGGAETVTVSGSGNIVRTGVYNDSITVSAPGNVVDAGGGSNTIAISETQGASTNSSGVSATAVSTGGSPQPGTPNGTVVILPAPGTGTDTITGFGSSDILDLTRALAGSGWDHAPGSVGQYVTLSSSNGSTAISVQGKTIATVSGSVSASQIVAY